MEPPEPVIMQRENERKRLALPGHRADDGQCCTVVVIQERRGDWAFYPHGWDRLGVRMAAADAVTMAQAILDGAR